MSLIILLVTYLLYYYVERAYAAKIVDVTNQLPVIWVELELL